MGTATICTEDINTTITIKEIVEKVQTFSQEDFSLIVSAVVQLCNQPHC